MKRLAIVKRESGECIYFSIALWIQRSSIICSASFVTAFSFPLPRFNKSTSVFYASVLLLMINCAITLSKWLWNHEPKFIFIGGQTHKKTDVNLFFTITRPETGQIPGINKVFERQV